MAGIASLPSFQPRSLMDGVFVDVPCATSNRSARAACSKYDRLLARAKQVRRRGDLVVHPCDEILAARRSMPPKPA